MKKSDILQRIPFDQECSYVDTRDAYLDDLYSRTQETSIRGSVNWLMEDASNDMDQNGMEKLVIVISAMLFMIEKDEVNPDIAYGAKWDILDFETGNYDDLFVSDDLKAIKADIKNINSYFEKHPEMAEGVEGDRRHAQAHEPN